MTEFSISEISSVDRPAQTLAIATIMKSAGPLPHEPLSIEQLKAGVANLATRFDALREQKAQKEAEVMEKTFNERVDEIAKRDGCSRLLAMSKARREAPEAFAKYQDEGEAVYQKGLLEKSARRESRNEAFNDRVAELLQLGHSRLESLRMARKRFAKEFVEYQNGI